MATKSATHPIEDQPIGPVVVLYGERRGKYPDGNSFLVQGTEASILIDPSLAMLPRRNNLPHVDWILNSHCHEDHIAGNHLFPNIPWHFHQEDIAGIQSLEGILAIYGFSPEINQSFQHVIKNDFHYTPKEDAIPYEDGTLYDLGGTTVRVLHTPGHTRGHCCFLIESPQADGPLLYLGDIDLTSFGPYYGDAWSDMEDFVRSLKRVRSIEAKWYATFHHIGVLDRASFLERLDRYEAVIQRRDERLLDFLESPRTLNDIVAHRFIYRPGDEVAYADPVERRSMSFHLVRLEQQGQVRQVEENCWVRI